MEWADIRVGMRVEADLFKEVLHGTVVSRGPPGVLIHWDGSPEPTWGRVEGLRPDALVVAEAQAMEASPLFGTF